MTRQAILERAAIVFQVMVLILGVITFRFNPNEPVFDTFSQALNVDISGDFFAILCAVGVVSSISVFRKRTMNEKAMAYIASASPIIGYLLPLGLYITITRGNIFTAFVYILFYGAFILIAFSVFRGADSEFNSTTTTSNTANNRE
jgi:hypothetical protein